MDDRLDFHDLDKLANLLHRYSADSEVGTLERLTALDLYLRVVELGAHRRVVAIIDDKYRNATVEGNGPGDAHLIEVAS